MKKTKKLFKTTTKSKLRKIAKRLFSIEKEDFHDVLCFLGLKIRKLNSKRILKTFVKQNKTNLISEYFDIFFDVSKCPQATGNQRLFQLASIEILKEVKYVCDKLNINYWIDWGTLLGAIRHGGYIPWDDDIDLGMMRKDYDIFIENFNKYKRNPYMQAFMNTQLPKDMGYWENIKIGYKFVTMDIFVYDSFESDLNEEEKINIVKEIKEKRSDFYLDNKHLKKDKYYKRLHEYNKEIIERICKIPNKSSLKKYVMPGIDFPHGTWNSIYEYGDIFPLKEISFENEIYKCPNNIEKLLKDKYKDYTKFPKCQIRPHLNFDNFKPEEVETMQILINGSQKQNYYGEK